MSPHKTRGYMPRDRRAYRLDGLWVLMPAYLLLQAGAAAILQPGAADQTTVAHLLPAEAELLWQTGYVLGALLMVIGLLWPKPFLESIGHWLCTWALGVNLFALLIIRGVAGAGVAVAAYAVTIMALGSRVRMLHQQANVDQRRMSMPFPGPDRRE